MNRSRTMAWLRGANFDGSFDWNRLDGVERFIGRNEPQNEFIDPELEYLRKQFCSAGKNLKFVLATKTFPVGNGNCQAVPVDWEWKDPERFERAVEEIHAGADLVCGSYDQLVRAARKKLLP